MAVEVLTQYAASIRVVILCYAMPQFKIGDRIRIVKPDIDHECRKGEISALQHSEELDRMEMRDEKFAQFRGYTVKLDTGHTKLYVGMDIEPLAHTKVPDLRLQISTDSD